MIKVLRQFLTPGRLIFGVLLVYLGFLIVQDLGQKRSLIAENKDLKERIDRQEVQKLYYQRLQTLLQEPAYLEKMARKKLQMVKKGESAYKVFIKEGED